MNLLIVDDEVLSVEGIAASLPWDELTIEHVYKAFSMREAQNIFLSHPIDILLCDIEMPKGNGIELMEWIRTQNYNPVSIFLTSFARFEYASNAVRLQMFDYVLKPCEYSRLTEVIRKAVNKVNEEKEKRQKELAGTYWNNGYQDRVNQFWHGLLMGEIPSDDANLTRELIQRHLDSSISGQSYYLLMLQIFPHQEMTKWKKDSWQYAVTNIVSELMKTPTVLLHDDTFLAIVPVNAFAVPEDFRQACHNLVTSLSDILPAESMGYCAPSCRMGETYRTLQLLKKESREKYALHSTVFDLDKTYTPKAAPDFSSEKWQQLLLSHQPDTIIKEIRHYFSTPNPNQYIDRNLLSLLYHQLLKAAYDVLDMYDLSPQLSSLTKERFSQEEIFLSISSFLDWVHEITEFIVRLIQTKEASADPINALTKYIRENLNSELNRSELTQVVHLHPDYLSALFRQKMGISLSEYVTKERIHEAKKLLLSTDLPINEIATRTGFQTISYFSKQFRRLENMTPNHYRKKHKQ